LTRIDDDDYLYHINICMVYEQRIRVALFLHFYFNLYILTRNHTLFLPVILSFKYNKQKVKIKSGYLCICSYLFKSVGTYALEGIQLYLLRQNPTENPKPLRHQIKVRIRLFYLKIRLLIRVQSLQQ
jgi:hypothetical protein